MTCWFTDIDREAFSKSDKKYELTCEKKRRQNSKTLEWSLEIPDIFFYIIIVCITKKNHLKITLEKLKDFLHENKMNAVQKNKRN